MGYNPSEPRGKGGRWVKIGSLIPSQHGNTWSEATDRLKDTQPVKRYRATLRVGHDLPPIETRGSKQNIVYDGHHRVVASRLEGKGSVQVQNNYPEIHASDLSTSDARRSPAVSAEEFQRHAARGAEKIAVMKEGATPPEYLDKHFARVAAKAYKATREKWGGVTIDAHTGEEVASDADAYALTIREPNQRSVSIGPKAGGRAFQNAMLTATQRFREQLSRPGSHIGVFRDEDTGTIDIDPVLVTPNLSDVHDIGAYTRATGGAYHFKSGDGYWPPHVATPKYGEKAQTYEQRAAGGSYRQKSKAELEHLFREKGDGKARAELVYRAMKSHPDNKPKAGATMRDMSTVFVTPAVHNEAVDLAQKDGRLAFWKQILPKRRINYTAKDGSAQTIDFDEKYLMELANSKAVDQIGFLLADKDNAHTMDPERWRGEVAELAVREDGLYGKIVFPSAEAAKAVLDNPNLGVSARIRPGGAGGTAPAGIVHVLGTLDPQAQGMKPWEAADLSSTEEVLDLSTEEYVDMAGEKPEGKELSDYTEEDIEKMSDEELEEFLSTYVPELDGYDEDMTDEDEDREPEGSGKRVPEPALSNPGREDIELANQAVAQANARANEAMRRVAEAEWREERNTLLSAGVPPHALDLATPVLCRADDMVIDLSNTGESDVNVSGIVRDLLDAMKGMVDLSNEKGHEGHFTAGDGDDPDKAMLDRWATQS